MPWYRTVNEPEQSRLTTSLFYGLNEELRIADGEFEKMQNMTGDEYPLLAVRHQRGEGTIDGFQGALSKVGFVTVEGASLCINGYPVYSGLSVPTIYKQTEQPEASTGQYWYNPSTGICQRYDGTNWSECAYPTKQLVSMGAYICVFPDGYYYNTQDPSDNGYMAATYQSIENANINYQICQQDGSLYGTPILSPSPPENPSNGDLWIDTSEPTYALHTWSAAQMQWVTIATVFTKITFTSMNELGSFAKNDAVTISGAAGNPELEALNGSHILYEVHSVAGESDYIVITGLLSAVYNQTSGRITIERSVPQMDYVCECNNRLWGCFYGNDGAQNLNELYCCALGDFKNWEQYRGISTDSWRASVGTDGPWTGCINYLGYPTFFKEDRLHRISVSSTGAHQVSDIPCRGVANGSHRSLAMVDEVLYYNSRDCICAYDGSIPVSVSPHIRRRFKWAVGGNIGKKYYMSGYSDGWTVLVYDALHGLWHEEDSIHVIQYCRHESDLYFVTADDAFHAAYGGAEIFGLTEETDVPYMAQTGLMGYEYPDQKYVSRFDFRVILPKDATLNLEVEYNSSGVWENALGRAVIGVSDAPRSFVIPVRPRRCDHLRFRLSGTGQVRVYSIARILEVGSDVIYPMGGV